jgi:hypothetical protein
MAWAHPEGIVEEFLGTAHVPFYLRIPGKSPWETGNRETSTRWPQIACHRNPKSLVCSMSETVKKCEIRFISLVIVCVSSYLCGIYAR